MRVSIFLLALVLFGCATPAARRPDALPNPQDRLDPLPEWDYDELVQAAVTELRIALLREQCHPPSADPNPAQESLTIEDARLLAWHSFRDPHRPLQSDEALFWLRFNLSGEDTRWALVWLIRTLESSWMERRLVHSLPFGSRIYANPPGNAEIGEFLTFQLEWGAPPGWIRRAGAVRERTWQEVIGEEPVLLYPALGGSPILRHERPPLPPDHLRPCPDSCSDGLRSSNEVLAGDEPAAISFVFPSSCACGFAPEAER
jgi:hypothetical protein